MGAQLAQARQRQPLFEPTPEQSSRSQLAAFIGVCERHWQCSFPDYASFEQRCLDESSDFWRLFLEWAQLLHAGTSAPAITAAQCELAQFFPGLQLNYTENLLRTDGSTFAAYRPALTAGPPRPPPERWLPGELRGRGAA